MSRVASTSKWHPVTSTYDYNYGVGLNFYQPMVDYLDQKDRGAKTPYPHLPWTDELGLSQYDPTKIKSYSCEALDRIARETEASAKEKLRNFRSTSQSAFQLSKSVSAATITEKVQIKKVVKKRNQLVRQIQTLKTKMADDLGFDRREQQKRDRDIELSLKASQKYLRGKSAKAIESYLESESRKNIAEAVDFDLTAEARSTHRQHVINTRECKHHVQFMDKRLQDQLEEAFIEPLDNLSKELKVFDKRSAAYFYDKR